MGTELIYKYFPELTGTQKSQIEQLMPLYREWNEKINVISRKDIDSLYLHHVLHSLAIAKVMQFPKGSSILDVGTGGGFPGIPLAIMFPESKFTLCDSIAKKIKVATEISQALGLANVETICGRVESSPANYDYIVSRAVTELRNFMPWIKGRYRNSVLYLKGGDLEEEISLAASSCRLDRNSIKTINISDFFEEEFFETKKVIFIKR